jgi:hypothetical protein
VSNIRGCGPVGSGGAAAATLVIHSKATAIRTPASLLAGLAPRTAPDAAAFAGDDHAAGAPWDRPIERSRSVATAHGER